ncbi:MAG: hypothetical protein KIT36_20335 [Alphaproteobacteria bacterium]|nr:hypothetical protein [Alphaproteobacteria bacterium]
MLFAIASLLAIAPGSASAQSVADVLQQWGLLGTWSADCQAPLSKAPRVTYVRQPDGNARHVLALGDGRQIDSPVLAARNRPEGGLEVTVNQSQEVISYVLVRGEDGRVRSLSSRRPNGDYYIRDGKLLANGAPTPWLRQCL